MDKGKEYLQPGENRRNIETNIGNIMAMYTPDLVKIKSKTKEVRVLSIGCGGAEEIPAVKSLFSRVKYTGVDSNSGMVKLARARYPEFQQDIIEVDATNSENLPIKQDLVLLRKPQVFGNSIKEHLQEQIVVSWQKILSNASDVIDMDGHLILTTPTIEEMEATIKYLKDQRPELVSELGKPFHQIDIPQDPVIGNEDKYIAVMRRKP